VTRRRQVGFETQVLVFLMLLVLLVVALGTANLLLSRSARRDAEATELASLRRESEAALLALGTASVGEALSRPQVVSGRFPSSGLAAWASRAGLEGGAVLHMDGTILSGTPPLRAGSLHPAVPLLSETDRAALGRGRKVVEPRGGPGPRWAFHPVRGPGGGFAGLVATAHRSAASPRSERAYRAFVWAQAVALVLAVVLSLVFLRFVLRPYRLLASAAGPAVGAGDDATLADPGDLVAHFQGVLGKLREQEDELRRLHAGPAGLAERIAGGMTSAVVALDAGGRVRTVNQAAETILGIRATDARGRPVEEALSSVEGIGPLARDCLVGEADRLEGAFCLLTDLTEIQHLQDQVRLKENLAALGELSAGVAHEFRNALATILGLARLVERRPDDAGAAAAAARDIGREVHQVREIVDEFLAYARPARLNRSRIALRELLEEVAEGARLEADGGPSPEIELHGAQGGEVLLEANLILEVLDLGQVGEQAERALEPVRLADDGPGFSEGALESAFVPFATTKAQGTGLGLPMVQKTIVQHDGEVWIGNVEGGGGEVRIRLPAEPGGGADRAGA
jgi:signal transduction histidine kinase